jgi:hypothetical protein
MLPLRRLYSGFMLRSEKRSGFLKKRRSRRRIQSGIKFLYFVATLIMLLAVFPAGAFMLWRNRLRWRGSVKLVVMFASLFAFFIIVSRLVTIPVENPLASQAQRAALDIFDRAQTAVQDTASRASRNFFAIWDNAPQIAVTVYNGVRGSAVYASKSIIMSVDGVISGPAPDYEPPLPEMASVFFSTQPPGISAGDAATGNPNTVVFITEKSVFYHVNASCQTLNMMSPSTILDAVNSDLKPCAICGAIAY